MAELTQDQQGTFDALQGMGFDPVLSRRAALKFGANAESAINWVLDPVDSPVQANDDLPPALISNDGDHLPHPSTLGTQPPPYAPQGPKVYGPQHKTLLPAPFVPPPSTGNKDLIDLTGDMDDAPPAFAAPPSSPRLAGAAPPPSSTKQDSDLAAALKASQVDDADDEMAKAISMSMATLGSTDDETLGVVDSIKPEDRIREPATPTILRASSNLMSGLSAFLQCLYAVPSFRQAILSYRAPSDHALATDDFKDYWRGDGGASHIGLPMPVDENRESRELRLIALQRLFAIMNDTHRSFVHLSEVVRAFNLRESEFTAAPSQWHYKARSMYVTILDDLRMAAGEEANYLLAQGVPAEEVSAFEKKANTRFGLSGRPVTVDEHIGAPLPPAASTDNAGHILSLTIHPRADSPDDLFTLLDKQLISENPAGQTVLHLLTAVPSLVLCHLDRQMPALTSLDSFGSSSASSGGGPNAHHDAKRVFRPTPTGHEDVWLDRYWIKNRVRVAAARGEQARLERERDELRARRDEVARTEEGADARELVRGTVEYLRRATAEGDEEREARQGRLLEQWEKVAEEMDAVIAAYDSDIAALDSRTKGIFDADDLHHVGPYRLVALLMRNGLNGRGTSWSVVRGDDGRWWKIVDLVREEVKLEDALGDRAGLMMDAGATFLFYQKMDEVVPVEVPAPLQRAIARDNHEFAASLPPSCALLVESWQLPPLSSLEPEEVHIPLLSGIGNLGDDTDTVRDISLEDSPPPVDITVDEGAAEALRALRGEVDIAATAPPSGTDTPMSLDGDVVDGADAEAPAMQLRGGASVEIVDDEEGSDAYEAEEDEYDDDEIDEDEVELGLVKPMPANRDEWDIDFAVGKVGGVPRWLDPRAPLSPEDVECATCHKTMALLLQVNSPDDGRPHAAARSLYLFACRSPGCLAKDPTQALKVWRTQMESPNAFFPHTDETQKERKRLEDALEPNSALSTKPSTPARPWPEFDIGAEPEPYEESYLPDPATPAPENEEGTEDAASADTKTGVDRAFLQFQERLEREPKQVLRFYRIPGVDDPQPLWASSKTISPSEVPTCELCRSERKVEFQVLSTLLSSLSDDAFEFDSLLVYTCASNCAIPPREGGKTGWACEVAFKQDFAAEGVKFGQR
ncbi:hypothetical protein JCM8208_007334 [Rhodotorula glutinis]